MSELIISRVDAGVGSIKLNRPRAINSLNPEMVQAVTEVLHNWAQDGSVRSVEFSGAGERGFSAGADVKELASALASGQDWVAALKLQYALNTLIAQFPKPVTAHMTGLTMGGGLGLAASASRRIVYRGTTLAMPETKIGFFPDAGVMFQLSRAGSVGTHLALTGSSFGGGTALAMNLADESFDGPLPDSLHGSAAEWIDACYAGDDPAEIISALENHPHPDARAAARDLRARSPYAIWIALRALRAADVLDHTQVLAQDLWLAERMVPVDFAEGVRALLIDKDNAPRWRHARIEDVPAREVDEAFSY